MSVQKQCGWMLVLMLVILCLIRLLCVIHATCLHKRGNGKIKICNVLKFITSFPGFNIQHNITLFFSFICLYVSELLIHVALYQCSCLIRVHFPHIICLFLFFLPFHSHCSYIAMKHFLRCVQMSNSLVSFKSQKNVDYHKWRTITHRFLLITLH